jgi:hypothetical protein
VWFDMSSYISEVLLPLPVEVDLQVVVSLGSTLVIAAGSLFLSKGRHVRPLYNPLATGLSA